MAMIKQWKMPNGTVYDIKAAQLTTTRYIYGNAFDGTQDVNTHFNMSNGDQINMTGASWDGFAFNYASGKSSGQSTRFYNGNMIEIVRFTAGGNVGIGTSSPSHKLHVSGDWIQIDSSGCDLQIGCMNSSYAHLQTSAPQFYFNKTVFVDGDIYRYNGTGTIYNYNLSGTASNADTLDGYHEYSFLRYRGSTGTNGEGSLWSQIGTKEYDGALPDGLSGIYNWGQTISFATPNARFEIYSSHVSSTDSSLWYRSGWSDDKRTWRQFIDSGNIGGQSVNWANTSGNCDGHARYLLINGVTWDSSWHWSGQGGQPSWLWGSNDGYNMYVWNPSNFSVNYSNSTACVNSAGTISAIGGTSRYSSGLRFGRVYNSGYPFSYGTTITMEDGAFGAELIFNGLGGGGYTGTGTIHYRTHSDWSSSEWGEWRQLWRVGDSVTSAVWNDYAEYREISTEEPGRCVYEIGDDTLRPTDARLMKGCSIISDTWGFAQGKTERAQTPIAVSGRVLAYPLEDRETFRSHIGDAVCSGPNGTVSIMSEDEVLSQPLAIIGTISAVPDYTEWGGGENADRDPVQVNGRVWIRIK